MSERPQEVERRTGGALAGMVRAVERELARQGRALRLKEWLKGALPRGYLGEEPNVVLLDAVRLGGSATETRVITATVKLLDLGPEAFAKSLRIGSYTTCCGSVRDWRARRSSRRHCCACWSRGEVKGEYRGDRSSRLSAGGSGRNQMDSGLSELWRDLLDGKPAKLPGGVRGGFEGIVRMPAHNGARVKLPRRCLRSGSGHSAAGKEYGSDEQERDEKFLDLIGQVKSVWGWCDLEWELLRVASESGWPEWVAKALGQGAHKRPSLRGLPIRHSPACLKKLCLRCATTWPKLLTRQKAAGSVLPRMP